MYEETMDILVDYFGTILHISDHISYTISGKNKVWNITEHLNVIDCGYKKYTIQKDSKIKVGTWCYDEYAGLYENPNVEEKTITKKDLESILQALNSFNISRSMSELDIEERLSKLELGL